MRLTPRNARPSSAVHAARREQILELNKRAQAERRVHRTPGNDGYLQFRMEEREYYFFIWKYPELRLGDAEQRNRAWKKFLNTEEGRPYRVNPYEGRRSPTHKGILLHRE